MKRKNSNGNDNNYSVTDFPPSLARKGCNFSTNITVTKKKQKTKTPKKKKKPK